MAERDYSKPVVYQIDGMRDARVQRDIVYRRDGDAELRMNVYAPARLSGEERAPAVLFVHGGPIPADMTPPTQWGVFVSYGQIMAASGLVGVTFNHRLHGLMDYARAQSDVAAAIEYVRSHAAEINVDPDKIALWFFSGGGPLMSTFLRDRPAYVRCVLAFYAYLDVREKAGDLPIFIARAGLDQPMINNTIDQFVQEALAGNASLELMNHAAGRHGFDIVDDDDRSREIIARAVAFAHAHFRRSTR